VADIVAKVENQTTVKISQKLISRGTVPDRLGPVVEVILMASRRHHAVDAGAAAAAAPAVRFRSHLPPTRC
jgi:hypothetical protein